MATETIDAEDFRKCMDSILERIKTCEQKIEEIDDDAYKWAKKAGAYKAHLWFLKDDVELFKKIYLKENESTPDKPTRDPKM